MRGAYGFGRVTLITLDVDQKPFSDWPDRSLFWVKALDLKRPRGRSGRTGPAMGGGRFSRYGIIGPLEPASRRARAVSRREADPVRMGRFLHLSLHPADRAGRLLLPEEGAQADGADVDHVPDDRADREPGGLLRGLRAQGKRPAGQQGRSWSISTRRPESRAGTPG